MGSKTSSRLFDFNIETIGQLAAIPAVTLGSVFGGMASRLLQLARGLDATPVLPFRKVPRLCVARTLERDEIDRERLEAILFRQVEEAGWRLRCHNRYPGQLALDVRYADGVTVRNQRPLSPITSQVDQRLFRVARSAFDRLVQRRIAVRRLVLELSDFAMPFRQLSLFPWEEATLDEDQKIQKALDAVRHRFGRQAISWGKTVDGVGCRMSDFKRGCHNLVAVPEMVSARRTRNDLFVCLRSFVLGMKVGNMQSETEILCSSARPFPLLDDVGSKLRKSPLPESSRGRL